MMASLIFDRSFTIHLVFYPNRSEISDHMGVISFATLASLVPHAVCWSILLSLITHPGQFGQAGQPDQSVFPAKLAIGRVSESLCKT